MDLAARQSRFKAIEDYRKRPLIVFATSTRLNVNAMMASDAIREFVDQIDAIQDGKEVDVLIHSSGGDPLSAWKLMSLLRERFDNVGVLVPFMAFSAATLFALGADDIFMHPHASLGPIDPQIQMAQADGSIRRFAYEDVGAFLRFLGTEVKITEQAHISAVIEKLFTVVDPVNVGAAKRASELSSAIGERLLLTHMNKGEDKPKAKQIAENLNKSFFAHGDAVSRKRAKELSLKITESNPTLEKLMWEAYLGIESYMQLREPFIPLQLFLADQAGAASLQMPGPLTLPANTPPQAAQQVWNQVLQQAMQNAANAGIQVPYSIVNAVIESTRAASEFKSVGRLSAVRTPTGEIQIAAVDMESQWKPVAQPQPGQGEEAPVQQSELQPPAPA
jgi:hypothetical protein